MVLPAIRAKVARILNSQGFSQSKIARELGITQAMVSKYITRYAPPQVLKEIEEDIENLAISIAEMIKKGAKREEIVKILERSFLEFLTKDKFCEAYERYSGISRNVCREIIISSDRNVVIEELSRALDILLRDEKFAELIPEIRSNFAYSLPNPRDESEVAAIPGRITVIKGRPYAMPPEFGVSRHTARLLVKISRYNPKIRSVINIRFGEDVKRAIEMAKLKVRYLPQNLKSIEEVENEVSKVFMKEEVDVIVDPGRHGVEPCVYIFGSSPLEVIGKLKKIENYL